MSKISSVYDALHTLVSSELTGYTQLTNPYQREDNSTLFLEKGYGIAVSGGANTNRKLGGKKTYERTFQLVLTNLLAATEHDTTAKENAEKSLLEDHATLITAFERDSDLGGNAALNIALTDDGIEFLEGGRTKYISLEITVTVEYFETI